MAGASGLLQTNGSLSALRVVIADDNVGMRRLLRSLLVGFGCSHIAEAGDGGAALAQLHAAPWDLLITDLLMEPMDGVELTRAIRDPDAGDYAYLPIIMVTGSARPETVVAARDAGVTEFLAKPLSAAGLWSRLYAVIERPRPFVRTSVYFGPDRRRRAKPDYEGPERRDDHLQGVA